ncbi:MAG: hypothetical protein AAF415_19355 [Pseudomonadota bacterium]
MAKVTLDWPGARDDLRLQEARDFLDLARRAPGLSLDRAVDAQPDPGSRGAGIEIGTFVMALATSGAITALIQVLQHYFSRNCKAEVSFESEAGAKMSISAKNMDPDEIEETARRLKAVFESK